VKRNVLAARPAIVAAEKREKAAGVGVRTREG